MGGEEFRTEGAEFTEKNRDVMEECCLELGIGRRFVNLTSTMHAPKPYCEWRVKPVDRAEDAANTFGFFLMKHCRQEALKKIESIPLPSTTEELQEHVSSAVDTALHNVMDLLEGFWRTEVGNNHTAAFALSVCIKNENREILERIDISPCMLDLPIGYWGWKDGEF